MTRTVVRMAVRVGWLAGALGLASGCGSSYSSNDGGTYYSNDAASNVGGDAAASNDAQAQVLMIASGMRFATPSMTVPAGTAITVRNEDSLPHTVTSESAPGAFTPDGMFNTGNIAPGGTATIMIPASTAPGTVLYYYCVIHTSLMVPADGMITVQ